MGARSNLFLALALAALLLCLVGSAHATGKTKAPPKTDTTHTRRGSRTVRPCDGTLLLNRCVDNTTLGVFTAIAAGAIVIAGLSLWNQSTDQKQPAVSHRISTEQYEIQSRVHTLRALASLRMSHLSQEVVGRLKNPDQFMNFLNGEKDISEDEALKQTIRRRAYILPTLQLIGAAAAVGLMSFSGILTTQQTNEPGFGAWLLDWLLIVCCGVFGYSLPSLASLSFRVAVGEAKTEEAWRSIMDPQVANLRALRDSVEADTVNLPLLLNSMFHAMLMPLQIILCVPTAILLSHVRALIPSKNMMLFIGVAATASMLFLTGPVPEDGVPSSSEAVKHLFQGFDTVLGSLEQTFEDHPFAPFVVGCLGSTAAVLCGMLLAQAGVALSCCLAGLLIWEYIGPAFSLFPSIASTACVVVLPFMVAVVILSAFHELRSSSSSASEGLVFLTLSGIRALSIETILAYVNLPTFFVWRLLQAVGAGNVVSPVRLPTTSSLQALQDACAVLSDFIPSVGALTLEGHPMGHGEFADPFVCQAWARSAVRLPSHQFGVSMSSILTVAFLYGTLLMFAGTEALFLQISTAAVGAYYVCGTENLYLVGAVAVFFIAVQRVVATQLTSTIFEQLRVN